jgi:hypothetical protein
MVPKSLLTVTGQSIWRDLQVHLQLAMVYLHLFALLQCRSDSHAIHDRRDDEEKCIVDIDAVVLGPTPLVSETDPLIKAYNVLTSFQSRRRRPLESGLSLLVFEPR